MRSMSRRIQPARVGQRKVADLEAALARETRTCSALREVGLALGTTLDLDQILELILAKITEALDADRATLYLLDEAKDELVSRIVQGEEVHAIHLKVGEGIAGHVARTGQAVHVKDAYADSRFSREWDTLSGYRTRQILAAPMKNHLGRTIGVIQVLNKRGGEFSPGDKDLLAVLSTQAAITIDNSQLFFSVVQKNMQLVEIKEQLENRVRDLKLLFSLQSATARAVSLEEIFMAVLGEAMRSTHARVGAVGLRDAASGQIFIDIVDDKHAHLRRFPLAAGQGLIGYAIAHGEVVLVKDGARDSRSDAALDALVGVNVSSALCVPLEGEEKETMGAIALYNKRGPRGFSDDDRALLQLVAANASPAIRLQVAREAQEREERLTTIGRLLSGIIHDMKTPLTVISGYVQLMQDESDKKKRRAWADAALKQFDHVGAMQREVLEFARGERTVFVRRVYLGKFFDEVRAQIEPQMARFGIELVIDLADKGTARFDEGKILRVVHNLSRNAIEAMADNGGRFTIKLTRQKADKGDVPDLVLTFSDTGPGIPKDIEPRLFQSFVTSGKKNGTGLGLAIVKKIAGEHGGDVTVRSSERGATFVLRIPQGKA